MELKMNGPAFSYKWILSFQCGVDILQANGQGYWRVVIVCLKVAPFVKKWLLIVIALEHMKDKAINISKTFRHCVAFLNVY